MGNRSLVIHYYNGTRYACANWVAITNTTNLTATTTASGSAYTTSHTATPSTMTNSTKSGAEVAHASMLKNVIGLIPVLAAMTFVVA
jgi:hypothetical protein